MTNTEPPAVTETVTEEAAATDNAEAEVRPGLLLANLEPPLPGLQLNLLLREGYKTVAAVDAASDEALLEIRGLGPTSLAVIRAAIARGRLAPVPPGHSPLAELTGFLPYQLCARLMDAGFRTVEEVAGSNRTVLQDLVLTARPGRTALGFGDHLAVPEIRAIHTAALTYMASKYTLGHTIALPPRHASEIVALLGQLALYADADGDSALQRRARALIRELAPRFPAPWNPARPRRDRASRSSSIAPEAPTGCDDWR